MFRRSLQVLVVSSIVALALIVGYATLQFRGAPEALAEAEAKFAQNQFARTIEILDICEPSVAVQREQAMRQRLWRLRMKANIELDNPRGALLDVENLLGDGLENDVALQLDRIRLLAKSRQGPRALQLARTFVAAHPDDPLALETAAQASRAASDERLERVVVTIRRDVGAAQRDRARDLLMIYLHRPDGDAELVLALAELEAMYAADTRLTPAWQPLLRELRELRAMIQEGQQFCRDSLALGGEPTIAQRESTRGLGRAGRTDDLLLQAEIFRRKFDNKEMLAAGRDATVALLSLGADAAAIATAARWLPSQSLEARAKKKQCDDAVSDLLMARLAAAWRRGDRQMVRRFFGDFSALQRGGFEPPLPTRLQMGLLHTVQQEWKLADSNLRLLTDLLSRETVSDRPFDVLDTVMPARLEVLRSSNAPEDNQLTVLNVWLKARPDRLEPRLTLARYLLDHDRVPAAQELLEETAPSFPFDAGLFLLRVATHAIRAERAGNGGEALLAQCAKRRVLVPDVADPMGYVLCAQAAIAHGNFDVVRECARMAVEAFPTALLPRVYEINACLETDRAQNAVELGRRMVATVPLDAVAAWLLVAAHRRAQQPLEGALFHALPLCGPSPQLRAEALRSALEHTPRDAIAFALPVLTDASADAGLRLLAARAFASAGRVADAEKLLDAVPAEAPLGTIEQGDRALAVAAWIEAAAQTTDDATLQIAAERRLASVEVRTGPAVAAFVATAEAVSASHPRTAYDLVCRALGAADPEARCGATLALAGTLASRLHRDERAEEHRLAAVAFPDGRSAAADLARAWIAAGRTDRARAAASMVETDLDPALALWTGDRKKAAELAANALLRDGADLVANCVQALLGGDALGDWRKVLASEIEERSELLAMLSGTTCTAEAVGRARSLVAAAPSPTSRLLLARALLQSGAFAESAALHDELLATKSPLLWRELALAAETPGYPLSARGQTALLEAMAAGECASSTITTVFALRRIVDNVVQTAGAAAAMPARELLWQQFPREGFRAATDLPHLAKVVNARLAFSVLEAAANDPRNTAPELRAQIRSALLARAEELAATGDDLTAVYTTVLQRLAADGAFGCIVHFLLDHGARVPTLRLDEATARQLLRAQIALTAAGRDDERQLTKTLDRIARDFGPAAATEDLESVLRTHPTSLVLWRTRAALLTREQRGTLGILQLSTVLAHVDAPAERLAMLSLAAAANLPAAASLSQFVALPRELRSSPEGLLAGGLLRLRDGSPDDAIPFLQHAAPQSDGRHLFALALAHLQSRAGNGGDLARECLLALARDYPSSSLARNAGNFAAQLAPR